MLSSEEPPKYKVKLNKKRVKRPIHTMEFDHRPIAEEIVENPHQQSSQLRKASLHLICAQSNRRADQWISTSSDLWDNLERLVELIEVAYMARLEIWEICSSDGDHAGIAAGAAVALYNALR